MLVIGFSSFFRFFSLLLATKKITIIFESFWMFPFVRTFHFVKGKEKKFKIQFWFRVLFPSVALYIYICFFMYRGVVIFGLFLLKYTVLTDLKLLGAGNTIFPRRD